jgi:hypothetical protein
LEVEIEIPLSSSILTKMTGISRFKSVPMSLSQGMRILGGSLFRKPNPTTVPRAPLYIPLKLVISG